MRTEAEIAWAAGLFEGEGHCCLSKGQPNVGVTSTDLDVLQRLQSIVGLGTIYGPELRFDWKPKWTWSVQASSEAIRVVDLFAPWFGERRLIQAEIVRTRAWEILGRAVLRGSRERPDGWVRVSENALKAIEFATGVDNGWVRPRSPAYRQTKEVAA